MQFVLRSDLTACYLRNLEFVELQPKPPPSWVLVAAVQNLAWDRQSVRARKTLGGNIQSEPETEQAGVYHGDAAVKAPPRH